MQPEVLPPEFSRPVPLGTIGHAGRQLVLEATAAERAALATRLGVLGIERLSAEVRLKPEEGGTVLVEGRLSASLIQACIVSLEPVAETVDEPIAFRLLPPGREPQDGPEDLDEIESPDGVADLGEAVTEELALALDPYPRAPGAVLPGKAGGAVMGGFAALAALRRKN
jgi:uncharacterized metal-binding protein YceD (DUF177 family)